ncbi:GNAT family N-acetyltransferase [Sphingorhabdus sp. SMR4y]|uniref:GNAT family N-acetyltransferase n=1 Tax=Sphingorhabdus sp. SMR4y TaxID=2584094 RepID=UPI000B5C26AD|nr:GNAT family N-acetyltransferase [Sphingorhabdus sp. SMR4y]ASK89764.1 acetyltransferase (GNAT) domain protein [Sphingorhabdus sp. SMR4y]
MNRIPITRSPVPEAKAAAIRAAVASATSLAADGDSSRLATADDAAAFHAFLDDPQIHAPIYTLPRPLTVESVRAFIADHQAQHEQGSGLLFLSFDEQGRIAGYSDICVWPEWAAGELGGALHPDRQGQRRGVEGARQSFAWMFECLGLDLICETAAPDNIRTAHLLDGLGFTRRGEIVSQRADGSTRPSLVWEITRAEWQRLWLDGEG